MIYNIGDTPKQLEQGLMFDGEVWTKDKIQALQAQVEQLRTRLDDILEDMQLSLELTANDCDVWKSRIKHTLAATPEQCLAKHDAEIAKCGFIEGYSSCWFEHYGTIPEQHSFDFSAEQYANQLRQAKGGE